MCFMVAPYANQVLANFKDFLVDLAFGLVTREKRRQIVENTAEETVKQWLDRLSSKSAKMS